MLKNVSKWKQEQLDFAAVDLSIRMSFPAIISIFKSIMAVAEFVVAGGDYMGTVPIALRRNGSYDDMIASVIEAGELTCEPNDLVINYQMMNGRGKIHPTFIKNDRHISLYMLDISIDGSRPTLRIHFNARPLII
ncbi:hypothetical protein RDI58_017437 [Solanum bulbocastanum]|uniref:Uncharacterized protein n=1 Tax=Solanum bulbocastanum TaxID=147425 RepID=A0AAN8TG32_SOLBU